MNFSYQAIPSGEPQPGDPPRAWRVKFQDGTTLRWEGFYTGPATLHQPELQAISRKLLELDLDDVPLAAAKELRPFVSDGKPTTSIVLHSATPTLNSLQADMNDALRGKAADDVAAYVETRSVYLAGPQDIVVGRTSTWRSAAMLANLEMIEIPGIEYYYLSHAILRLAVDQGPAAPSLARLIAKLRAEPHTLVRLYALDREIQMVLLYLKRQARIDFLYTDANSPELAEYWNTKAPLHPTVEDAIQLDADQGDAFVTLTAESALSPLKRRLRVDCPVLPGYTVEGRAHDPRAVHERLTAAARMLRERYGIAHGCLKPSNGGAGARIVAGVDLSDGPQLHQLGERIFTAQEQFILEAQFDYLQHALGNNLVQLAPSVHVRHGHLAPGMTLQITNGTSWQGNIYIDADSCGLVGMSAEQYDEIRADLERLHRGFSDASLSVVTAGFDFAVGRVEGLLASRVLVALQDPNLSSHGAEYLRLFRDRVQAAGGPGYAATKVIIPRVSLPELRAETRQAMPDPWAEVISAIPGRWGMLAVAASSPRSALDLLTEWEHKWVADRLIDPASYRGE